MLFKKIPKGTKKVAGGCGCQPLVRLACVLLPPTGIESEAKRKAKSLFY